MSDLKNIGLTGESTTAARALLSSLSIADLKDVARLGFAYAVSKGERPVRDSGGADWSFTAGANFNVATIDDAQGNLRELVTILYPGVANEPYRAIETLMNIGIVRLAEDVRVGNVTVLSDLLSQSPSEA